LRGIIDAVRRARAGFGVLLALTALGVVMAPGAQADTVKASASAEVVVKRGDRGTAVRQIQSKLGISADGVFGPQTERAVRRFQRSKGLLVDGVVGPQTRSALGLEPFSSRALRRRSSGGDRVPGILRAIAECESGGDPRAVSRDGLYRGKYQFSQGTWEGLGGRGDPAKAPEWKQDQLALKLYRQRGNAPWPNCP
jgi:Transglycosylase-like domain/Putative peptidoglycan binding domain